MKWLKITGITIGTLFLMYLIILWTLPSEVYVKRSIVINASTNDVFDYIEDLHNFEEWAYWAQIDPNTNYTYTGPEKGPGSRMDWDSDHPAMAYGSWWIVSTTPTNQVKSKIQLKDFAKPANMDFKITSYGDSTKVIWNFRTTFHGYWKFFVPMMEEELGPTFNVGLENIKKNLEKRKNLKNAYIQ